VYLVQSKDSFFGGKIKNYKNVKIKVAQLLDCGKYTKTTVVRNPSPSHCTFTCASCCYKKITIKNLK
jgi:hypothetical protein